MQRPRVASNTVRCVAPLTLVHGFRCRREHTASSPSRAQNVPPRARALHTPHSNTLRQTHTRCPPPTHTVRNKPFQHHDHRQHNPAARPLPRASALKTGRLDDLTFDPLTSPSSRGSQATKHANQRDKMAKIMGAKRSSIFGAMLEVGHEDPKDPVSCWQQTRKQVWSIFSIQATNRMAVTNFKLRVGSTVFTVASLSCFVAMLIFCSLTPSLSATLIIITAVWGLVCVPVGGIYHYMLWVKQTETKQSATSTGKCLVILFRLIV